MIDPDSPEKDDDTSKQVLHYMKTDFSVKEFTKLSSVAAAPAVPYAGPNASVGTGLHRYIFLLYVQKPGFTNKGLPEGTSRDFNVSAWRIENQLDAAVAGIHFVALPGGGAAPIASSVAAPVASAAPTSVAYEYTTVAPPCTSTVMWTSTSTPVAVELTTASAIPTTYEVIASSPVAAPSAAATHWVKVGGPDALQLTYQPAWVEAAVGDIVKFDFLAKNHTVTQSTFDTPCVFNPAGVKSGFRPNLEGVSGKETFEFTVADIKPKWFFCAQGKHCQAGMVFAINPGTKFPEYVAKATGGAAASSSYGAPAPTTFIATGTGSIPVPTGNSTVPGSPGFPVFTDAAPGRIGASWALAAVAGMLVFFL